MQKRKYIKPEIEEIKLQQEGHLLSDSGDDWNDEYGSITNLDINKQV